MSAGATARLFVAIDPPEGVREALVLWARNVARGSGSPKRGAHAQLRVLEGESLHLTLCFLGSRPLQEIDAITAALSSCAGAGVHELSLGAPLWLPVKRPRALAVEVKDRAGELARLHGAIAGLSGSERPRRRFRAHITVARARASRATRGQGSPDAAELPPTPELRFTPDCIVLYRSRLAPAGASYEALASARLLPTQL
ncbi:MAG: RNA 2',3'-cyclic phosphodiesterase [Solirubrobacteraceae bacterium]|jgi:2'-5' RNA ligase